MEKKKRLFCGDGFRRGPDRKLQSVSKKKVAGRSFSVTRGGNMPDFPCS